MAGPKTFISYSWTSPAHERWVMDLATELVEKGVQVILDKWHLREGHDAVQFMESMVVDPEVTKVVIVSDKRYAEKADKRRGGVGTESQIMSGEIYKKTDQTKFVAVLSELDEDGAPCLPTFLGSRKYIDMSSDDRYATNFEQLLRWLYDKPMFVMPTLGEMPEFLKEDTLPSPTRSKAKRATELTRNSAASAPVAMNNYLESLIAALENFRIDPNHKDFPQAVLDSIDAFLPYRNEFIEFMFAAAPESGPKLTQVLQRFFEGAIPFMSKPPSVNSWKQWDFDNFVFIVHELFLYSIAILLRYERFETVAEVFDFRFYVKNDQKPNEAMQPFSIIRQPLRSLEAKQQELRRVSLRADLLEKRSHGSGLQFESIMAADFVLFLRSAISEDDYHSWYPETLLYSYEMHGPFEIFARAESATYFKRLSPVVGIANKEELETLLGTFSVDGRAGRWLPRWNYHSLNLSGLSNVAKLASRP
ncbi:hypothetical protein V1279_007145 [Bradyrhizobium sp. AZCC 1610]|uniref:SEFIR domain-containing protein n=1 Tax=Bradyrhizobium sp. AZCC 1610 TaxID=3117020 RepID=UPI002FF09E1C